MKNIYIIFKNIIYLSILICSIICIIKIIFDKRDPKSVIIWILLFIISRPLGLILYFLIGRNWRDEKFENETDFIKDILNKKYRFYTKEDIISNLQKLIFKNTNTPVFPNNCIKIFVNGNDKFRVLKEELKKAKHHIHLQYYIVRDDTIGNEIKNILIKKSKEGIKVKFIIDRIGSKSLGKKYVKELKDNNIKICFYSYFFNPFYRNHKKIVVIDGKVGFIGGMNIGDEYEGKGKLGFWRDLHIIVKGDFVSGLQSTFLHDFYTLNNNKDELLSLKKDLNYYFPDIDINKYLPMQFIESGPSSKNPSIMHVIVKMISCAKDHIYIATPYFIPSESLMTALKIASLSGINVTILFPGKYDHFHVYYASRTYLCELAKCGAKIYLYKDDSFIHSKLVTIDGTLCTLGNANIDIRAFKLNYESNAVIYHKSTTEKIEELFIKDIKQSKLVDDKYFENSSIFIKILENISRIFSSAM